MDEIEVDDFYTAYLAEEKLLALFDDRSGQRILHDFTGVVKNSTRIVTMLDGLVHSFDDKPALLMLGGSAVCTKQWVCNGLISRHTGPALIYYDGARVFAIEGNKYAFDEFIKLSKATDEQKIEMLLKYS